MSKKQVGKKLKVVISEQDKLKSKLKDWKWRLKSWKLYKIKDKYWKVIPFKPNKYQIYLIDNLHYKNLILKARQLGFSTLIQVLMLDQALFRSNVACWVIAQWLREAKSIFDNKIKFAYDNLPLWLRAERPLKKDSTDTLEFSNWSSIYVWTSFRWWTLQYLHISEYWKICAKFPDRAKEINTWALEAVAEWNYVFIESTAEWKSWDFYDKSETAKKLTEIWKKLNVHEYKFFFFAWWEVDEYRLEDDDLVLSKETKNYFKKLKEEEKIDCDETQMKWYQVKAEEKKDEMLREYPSTPEEAFMVAIAWSYYKKWITKVREEWRLCRVPYEVELPVYTGWDLGGAWWWDAMVIWFYQVFWKEIRIIDFFAWTWYWLKDIHREILMPKPYNFWTMYLPHDAKVHSLNDRKTREETMIELWYEVEVLPKTLISDRIDSCRDSFKYMYFDKENCSDWLDKTAEYRRKWNDSTGCFMNVPEHKNSDVADALWYLAQAVNIKLESRIWWVVAETSYEDYF